MKLPKYLLIIGVIFSNILIAQTKETLKALDERIQENGSYPVDPAPYLERYYKKIGFDPTKEYTAPLQKKSSWNFKIGDKKSFKVADLSSSGSGAYSTDFTCRAVGDYCYIFVEDSLWTNRVDQNAVDSVRIAFDSKTPANNTKGIYKTNTEIFGSPKDVDGDPKIIILIHNIRDGYNGSGGYVAGYFSSADQTGSNGNSPADIYHLDGNPLNLRSTNGLKIAMSTTAHEFQHMIHYNYLPDGNTFINEGFSLAAEIMCGYGVYSQSGYANETNFYLLKWRDNSDPKVLNDYSRAARFFLYMYEQFGGQFFTKYLSNKINYITGINNALTQLGTSRKFIDIVGDFFIANILNNKSVDPKWGYNYPNLGTVASTNITNPNISGSGSVYNLGAQYLSFTNGKNLSIKFTDKDNWSFAVKAIKFGSGTPEVENVTVGSTYNVPEFGTKYYKVTFAIYFANSISLSFNETTTAPYTYVATGTSVSAIKEIAYDTTEPLGVYVQSVGDTVLVQFDGISGAKLDSIRVALRNKVPIEGGIWRTGTTTINGKKLASFTATGITVPSVPYPVPWTNWVKVDLRSLGIDASTSFNTCFIIDGVYENSSSPTNRVMYTNIPGSEPYHSYTYLNKPSSGSPRWVYLGDNTNISIFLIRAYVTIGGTDIDGPVEILPSAFNLEQNYPNPFNPSTVISYNLPKQSKVSIKIYDALGHEIRSLINEEKVAGKYNIYWDGRNNLGIRVSSGVYFYTLIAGDFIQTKKMILTK